MHLKVPKTTAKNKKIPQSTYKVQPRHTGLACTSREPENKVHSENKNTQIQIRPEQTVGLEKNLMVRFNPNIKTKTWTDTHKYKLCNKDKYKFASTQPTFEPRRERQPNFLRVLMGHG